MTSLANKDRKIARHTYYQLILIFFKCKRCDHNKSIQKKKYRELYLISKSYCYGKYC